MKIQKKSGILLAFAGLAMLSLGSCSRGYGCPYDFSVTKSAFQLIATCFQTLISLL
ncbi:MAG: hypothetical protein IPO16_05810 [Saprospiraceae bacterium]|nr:hypothetical protein [Saprospiraceae bacterium]MBK9221621.1 hypothetical protein [Saprospiraceae bacterium]